MLWDTHTGLLENGLMKNYGDCIKRMKSRRGLKTPENHVAIRPK